MQKKYKDINQISSVIVKCKYFYCFSIFILFLKKEVSFQRPLMYVVFTFLHQLYCQIAQSHPEQLQPYHGFVMVFTHCNFIFNPSSMYDDSDRLSLMIGFVGFSYISSTFLNYSYKYTMMGQFLTCVIASYHYAWEFDYLFAKIGMGMVMMVATVGYNSFFVEKTEKTEFLKHHETLQLQQDLKNILHILPEGVFVNNVVGENQVKYTNKQFENLFSCLAEPSKEQTAEDSAKEMFEGLKFSDFMFQRVLLPKNY